jgi:hypothetical protein
VFVPKFFVMKKFYIRRDEGLNLVMQHALSMSHIVLLGQVRVSRFLNRYVLKGRNYEVNLLNIKIVFRFSPHGLSGTFLILR